MPAAGSSRPIRTVLTGTANPPARPPAGWPLKREAEEPCGPSATAPNPNVAAYCCVAAATPIFVGLAGVSGCPSTPGPPPRCRGATRRTMGPRPCDRSQVAKRPKPSNGTLHPAKRWDQRGNVPPPHWRRSVGSMSEAYGVPARLTTPLMSKVHQQTQPGGRTVDRRPPAAARRPETMRGTRSTVPVSASRRPQRHRPDRSLAGWARYWGHHRRRPADVQSPVTREGLHQ